MYELNPLDVCLETCHPDDRECFKQCITGEEGEE